LVKGKPRWAGLSISFRVVSQEFLQAVFNFGREFNLGSFLINPVYDSSEQKSCHRTARGSEFSRADGLF
jgi:hypothetical protein